MSDKMNLTVFSLKGDFFTPKQLWRKEVLPLRMIRGLTSKRRRDLFGRLDERPLWRTSFLISEFLISLDSPVKLALRLDRGAGE